MDKKELEHRLDRLCSTFVRYRENRCYTCNKQLYFRDREAGHYLPREIRYTRWNLQNIHVQCHKCNYFLGGNLPRYKSLMQARDPHSYHEFEAVWECYLHGNCAEPTYEQKKLMYNNMLDMVRTQCPQEGAYCFEWQKIE